MRRWELTHDTNTFNKQRGFYSFDDERSDPQGKPYWAFAKDPATAQDMDKVNQFLHAPNELLGRMDRVMEARLPNASDEEGVVGPERFGYLESSVMPTQYFKAVA